MSLKISSGTPCLFMLQTLKFGQITKTQDIFQNIKISVAPFSVQLLKLHSNESVKLACYGTQDVTEIYKMFMGSRPSVHVHTHPQSRCSSYHTHLVVYKSNTGKSVQQNIAKYMNHKHKPNIFPQSRCHNDIIYFKFCPLPVTFFVLNSLGIDFCVWCEVKIQLIFPHQTIITID